MILTPSVLVSNSIYIFIAQTLFKTVNFPLDERFFSPIFTCVSQFAFIKETKMITRSSKL